MVGRSMSGCNKPGYKAATHPVVVSTHEKPSQTGGVHIISDEPVCYPVRRAIYAGTRITRCSTASPTKMRTGSMVRVRRASRRSSGRSGGRPSPCSAGSTRKRTSSSAKMVEFLPSRSGSRSAAITHNPCIGGPHFRERAGPLPIYIPVRVVSVYPIQHDNRDPERCYTVDHDGFQQSALPDCVPLRQIWLSSTTQTYSENDDET